MDIIHTHSPEFDKSIDHLKQEISALRTGRATPLLVEDVSIEAYGGKQPLKALASIFVVDAKTLQIQPWDKSILSAIESGIRNNPTLGLNPVNDGTLIRLVLPDLTAERRQELIKVLHQKLENAKISVRKVREDVREAVQSAEKGKEISEDEKFALQEELEKMVKEYNEKIRVIGEEKEKEIQKI